MIVDLIGLPGVGKLTIGGILADRLKGRLLDAHSIYNVGFALTEFRSDAFYDAVRAVRNTAYRIAAGLPFDVPLILTTASGRNRSWAEEGVRDIVRLAQSRGSTVFVVHLTCDIDENRRRIGSAGRLGSRKPTSLAMLDRNEGRFALTDHADHLLELDVTHLSSDRVAEVISEWIARRASPDEAIEPTTSSDVASPKAGSHANLERSPDPNVTNLTDKRLDPGKERVAAGESYMEGLRRKIGNDLVISPSVAAVIHDPDGRLLLQEKASGEGWSLPAGGIEIGEAPQDAIVREVREETGWDVAIDAIIGVLGGKAFRYTYPSGDEVEYVVTLFRCSIIGGDGVPLDSETRSTAFFARHDMPSLALPYPLDALFESGEARERGAAWR